MRHFYALILLCCAAIASAQTLSPTVIASAGGSYSSAAFSMDYTLGETFITTLSNSTNILTQGFHQPVAAALEGCTAVEACNYDPEAIIDDGSCILPGYPCDDANPLTLDDAYTLDCACVGNLSGCTSPTACNFDINATIEDGTCTFPGDACDDGDANTVDDMLMSDCTCAGQLVNEVAGCIDADACNYDLNAAIDDGSCYYPGDACSDGNALTTNDAYGIDCICVGEVPSFSGCTDPLACNFDAAAILDDGSCYAPGDACDDGNVFTENDVYVSDCSCQGTDIIPVLGCTAVEACNYDALANIDNGSCILPGAPCDDTNAQTVEDSYGADCVCSGLLQGCTEPSANNYNPLAIVDDGSCEFDVPGCTNPDALNYDANANVDDGSCVFGVLGCTAVEACNYNALATVEDNSCILPGAPCNDGNDNTVDDVVGSDCTCAGALLGCTQPDALNYNPAAVVDDGSCVMPVLGCTDATACNFEPQANTEDGSCVMPGCLDDVACNYDPTAPCNDFNMCDYPAELYLDCAGNCLNDVNVNGLCDETEAHGCTDPVALNYDAAAIFDDGSCVYTTIGCTTPGSCNYNPLANVDDGSCTTPGCNDPEACNFDPTAGCYDGNCDYPVPNYDCNGVCLSDTNNNGICDQYEEFGCTDEVAINYNPNATSDDGSCIYAGCTDVAACNYDANADVDDASCTFPGCNDADACNYDATAGCLLAGSCTYPDFAYDCAGNCLHDGNLNGICDEFDSEGCTDVLADNYNLNATIDDGSCIYVGCTNPVACNFDPIAIDDDGSCTLPGCNDVTACNYDAMAGCDDGSCIPSGCTDSTACNYNAAAACDNGSCTFPGCNDAAACNYDAFAGCLLEGSCSYPEYAYDCNGNCLLDGNGNGICDQFDDFGCMDPIADNYNPFALQEDGSCIYIGCMDVNACNFDPTALTDDGSCSYPSVSCLDCAGQCLSDSDADGTCDCLEVFGCTNPLSVSFDPNATEFDGSCILGCNDPFAINYDNQATENDGSCVYQILGCTYPTACNFNADATTDNNSCIFPGCNDFSACNFDPNAGCLLEGSCEYLDVNNNGQCDLYEIYGCTNGDACNYNPQATYDDGSCGFDSDTTIVVTTGGPYEWNGQTLTESGLYPAAYTTAEGCDSLVTLNLTITAVHELDLSRVQIWPNPANMEVSVLINAQAAETIEVFDIVGKHVITVQRQTKLDVSSWASGVYMLRVHSPLAVIERRLEVVR